MREVGLKVCLIVGVWGLGGCGRSSRTTSGQEVPTTALSLRSASDQSRTQTLSAAPRIGNRAGLGFDQVVATVEDGVTPVSTALEIRTRAGLVATTFTYDADNRLAIWTAPSLGADDYLLRYAADGEHRVSYPLLVAESGSACSTAPAGANLVWPTTATAVGTTARPAVEAMFASAPLMLDALLFSENPEVAAAGADGFSFVAAGDAHVLAVACGMLVSADLEVSATMAATPECVEMAGGITAYAAAHPDCMQKALVVVPACAAQAAAAEQALAAAMQCAGECDAEREAALAARTAYSACQTEVTANGVACGAERGEVVARCQILAGSACDSDELTAACAGVL